MTLQAVDVTIRYPRIKERWSGLHRGDLSPPSRKVVALNPTTMFIPEVHYNSNTIIPGIRLLTIWCYFDTCFLFIYYFIFFFVGCCRSKDVPDRHCPMIMCRRIDDNELNNLPSSVLLSLAARSLCSIGPLIGGRLPKTMFLRRLRLK